MTISNLSTGFIALMLFSTVLVSAQSKKYGYASTKGTALDASRSYGNDSIMISTYIIIDLYADTEENFIIQVENEIGLEDIEEMNELDAKLAIANTENLNDEMARREYRSELDFLLKMQAQELELISVIHDEGEDGPFKRFYFRKNMLIDRNAYK